MQPPSPPRSRSLPTPEATPGGEEEDDEDYEEEEEEEEEEDNEEEGQDCPPLDDIRQAVGVLEEEVLVHQEVTREAVQVSLLQKRVKTLRSALNRFARGQMRRLDRLESRLHEALLYQDGSPSSLERILRRVPGEKVGRLQMFAWDFTDALWRFLQSDAQQDLPAQMRSWRKEVEALLGSLYALKLTPLRMQKKETWTEMLSTSRMHEFLSETGNLDAAAALLQEALMEVWREDGVVPLQKMLIALRRGPLKEMSKVEMKQSRLDSVLAALLAKQGIPMEEEVLVVQREIRGIVGVVNPVFLKEVESLPEKVGTFLKVGGKSSREILALLCIPSREVEALANSVDAVCEALFRITQSVPVDAPQRKVRAMSHRLEDLNRVLRSFGRQPVLQDGGAQDIPLEELANLSEKLWSLRDILRMRAVALNNSPLKKAKEVPTDLDPLTPLPTWNIQKPQPRKTSKAKGHNAETVLASTGTAGSFLKGNKPQKKLSKPVFCVTSSADMQATPLYRRRPAPSTGTASTPVAGLDPVAGQGPATLSAPRKRPPDRDDASTSLNVKARQAPPLASMNGTSQFQHQDVQNPEETSDAGNSEDALSFCSRDGSPEEGSEPPFRRQKTEDLESAQRNIVVQELFEAYKNYANYITDALNEDREKMDHLVVGLLHPSCPLHLLKEAKEAEVMTATMNETVGCLNWLKEDL